MSKVLLIFILSLPLNSTHAKEPLILMEWNNGWGESSLIMLTGFGPFGYIKDNPSSRVLPAFQNEIQKKCGNPNSSISNKKLPVEAGIIESIDIEKYKTVISIGVHDGSQSIRIETAARNYFYDYETGKGFPIDPNQPENYLIKGPQAPRDLFKPLEGFLVTEGSNDSAGTYVCNDTYYRLCQSKTRGYFIHIPNILPVQDLPLSKALATLSCRLL